MQSCSCGQAVGWKWCSWNQPAHLWHSKMWSLTTNSHTVSLCQESLPHGHRQHEMGMMPSNWFFHNWDNHPIWEEGDWGERALLLYTSRTCLDWHNKLVLHKAYNIATINEDLLAEIACELDIREVWANIEQVCISMCTNHMRLNFSLPHLHTPSHPQSVTHQYCCCC